MSELHKFLFEGLPVRGMLVRLTDSWQELLARRAKGGGYPAPVRSMLGEMTAAAVLMQANLKFNGSLILQVHGDGPVKLAVAEAQPELRFRATATLGSAADESISETARLEALVNVHGRGRCVITLDAHSRQPGQQPYQGVVPLHGDQREPLQHVSQVLEHYMLQSEQLDTRLVLAANDSVAAGLLIQRLPVEGSGNLESSERNEDQIGLNEHFNRIAHLSATLTQQELLALDVETVLRRLYWQESVRRFEPLQPSFACNCSRERVRRMLEGLGQQEVDDIIAEQGRVEIGCEFCGLKYHFDPVDVGGMFRPQQNQPPGTATLN